MPYDILYMWNLKRNDTNELIYKTETDSDLGNELMVAGGGGQIGVTDREFGMDSAIFKMDNQQGPTV